MSLLTTPAAVDAARRAVDASSPISVPRDADTAVDALLAYHARAGRARLASRLESGAGLSPDQAAAAVTLLVGEAR